MQKSENIENTNENVHDINNSSEDSSHIVIEEENKNESQLEIIVRKHQQIYELLKKPNEMWRVLFSLFLIIIVILIGLTIIAITLKRFYPYSTIETNLQGASIMKSEDKDVIYWLFNTADLWSNSGIEVEKGDELTIRASGSSYTAIHHLVDASTKNDTLRDRWVGTDGDSEKKSPRDMARGKFRLVKNADEGMLLMKIVEPQDANINNGWIQKDNIDSTKLEELLGSKDVIIIGKERTLKVGKSGILHFAVNDIVLTPEVIKSMNDSSIISELELGKSPNNSNELDYYKEKHFYNAWYVDNIGSFLIVIERKR